MCLTIIRYRYPIHDHSTELISAKLAVGLQYKILCEEHLLDAVTRLNTSLSRYTLQFTSNLIFLKLGFSN